MQTRIHHNGDTGQPVLPRLLACLLAATLFATPAAAGGEIIMFAAASLKTALDAVAQNFHAGTGVPVRVSYAGTPTLARQIENGAPADIIMAADEIWMDHLEERRLIRPGTRQALLGNRLVLIVPTDAGETIPADAGETIDQLSDILSLLGPDGRLALANTRSVPAGRYALEALQSLGLWAQVANRTVEGDNVRAALSFVVRNEAPAGIVYATDAMAETRVTTVADLPADTHTLISYPVAMTLAAGESAGAFFDYLLSPAAANEFRRGGFIVLGTGD